jgi:hypothetical protein
MTEGQDLYQKKGIFCRGKIEPGWAFLFIEPNDQGQLRSNNDMHTLPGRR